MVFFAIMDMYVKCISELKSKKFCLDFFLLTKLRCKNPKKKNCFFKIQVDYLDSKNNKMTTTTTTTISLYAGAVLSNIHSYITKWIEDKSIKMRLWDSDDWIILRSKIFNGVIMNSLNNEFSACVIESYKSNDWEVMSGENCFSISTPSIKILLDNIADKKKNNDKKCSPFIIPFSGYVNVNRVSIFNKWCKRLNVKNHNGIWEKSIMDIDGIDDWRGEFWADNMRDLYILYMEGDNIFNAMDEDIDGGNFRLCVNNCLMVYADFKELDYDKIDAGFSDFGGKFVG
jgi:hypothetical protein